MARARRGRSESPHSEAEPDDNDDPLLEALKAGWPMERVPPISFESAAFLITPAAWLRMPIAQEMTRVDFVDGSLNGRAVLMYRQSLLSHFPDVFGSQKNETLLDQLATAFRQVCFRYVRFATLSKAATAAVRKAEFTPECLVQEIRADLDEAVRLSTKVVRAVVSEARGEAAAAEFELTSTALNVTRLSGTAGTSAAIRSTRTRPPQPAPVANAPHRSGSRSSSTRTEHCRKCSAGPFDRFQLLRHLRSAHPLPSSKK